MSAFLTTLLAPRNGTDWLDRRAAIDAAERERQRENATLRAWLERCIARVDQLPERMRETALAAFRAELKSLEGSAD